VVVVLAKTSNQRKLKTSSGYTPSRLFLVFGGVLNVNVFNTEIRGDRVECGAESEYFQCVCCRMCLN